MLVGTKRQAQDAITEKRALQACSLSNNRWWAACYQLVTRAEIGEAPERLAEMPPMAVRVAAKKRKSSVLERARKHLQANLAASRT